MVSTISEATEMLDTGIKNHSLVFYSPVNKLPSVWLLGELKSQEEF
jgi:hypothetical protein